MTKKLRCIVSLLFILFMAACNKSNDILSPDKNTKPIAVLTPTLYFIEDAFDPQAPKTLYAVNNLAGATPTVNKGTNLLGITAVNFNTLVETNGGWAYNQFTNEIIELNKIQSLMPPPNFIAKMSKLSTVDFSLKQTNLSTQLNLPTNVQYPKISPNGKEIYYIRSDNANSMICKANVDGTQEKVLFKEMVPEYRIENMDIDFVHGNIYCTFYYFEDNNPKNNISVISLDGQSILFGKSFNMKDEDLYNSTLKVDPVTENLYLSSTNYNLTAVPQTKLGAYKIWSISKEARSEWKEVVSVKFPVIGEYTRDFSFDIFPLGKTIFYRQRLTNINNHVFNASVISRINMDGTGDQGIFVGRRIRNLVVALPAF